MQFPSWWQSFRENTFFIQVRLDLVVTLPILLSLCLAQLEAALCLSALRGCC